MSDCQKSVANKSAMQVQNLKSTLNEWKYVVALLDQVFLLFFNGQVIFLKGLNAADPIKSASARAGIYTTLYIILLVTKVRFYSFETLFYVKIQPSVLTLVSVLLALAIIADIFIGKINDKVK